MNIQKFTKRSIEALQAAQELPLPQLQPLKLPAPQRKDRPVQTRLQMRMRAKQRLRKLLLPRNWKPCRSF